MEQIIHVRSSPKNAWVMVRAIPGTATSIEIAVFYTQSYAMEAFND
mgnify:CR=1 FL=1